MERLKTHFKALCREGLYFLATAICTFLIYVLLKGLVLPFTAHLTDAPIVPILATIALALVCIYIFTKLYVGWKYSFRNRGDYEIIRKYKDRQLGGIIEECRVCFKREIYFIIFVVLTAILNAIFEPLIYLVKYLYILNDIMPDALGATASFALIVISYFLNLYLYRRRVYRDFYISVENKKHKH